MLDQELLVDIRIIKFQGYIRRKPNRPFGYYGLGVQYMLSGKPALADKMFMQAIKLDPLYIPALLGKLEVFLAEKRFTAAARYFNKHKDLFCNKKISKKRIHRMVSRLYMSKSLSRRGKSIVSQFLLKENFITLNRIYNKTKDNLVANILLSAFWLQDSRVDEKAIKLYRYCIELDEISDKLRWDLLQVLSKKEPDLLQSKKIAGLFSAIPENAYGKDYADFLLTTFIYSGDQKKAIDAFSSFETRRIIPCKKNLWHYLFFCREWNIWDSSLTYCCQKLLSTGWVDGLLTSTIKELNSRGLWERSREFDQIFLLYS
ncbi:MAG TPA: hypothetical protein DEP23_09910 [Ruminococcaceae bacterium]|jgi:tetratricopeptide (TPR) repeat protein|nr:hypothetical protein [Oscillospiraceae bacterium]